MRSAHYICRMYLFLAHGAVTVAVTFELTLLFAAWQTPNAARFARFKARFFVRLFRRGRTITVRITFKLALFEAARK